MNSSKHQDPWLSLDTQGIDIADEEKADALFAVTYPLRILVADSDYISRRRLILMLEHYGYKVTSVDHGLDCLQAVLARPCDLIFLAIEMPVMDGFECTRSLRREGIDTSIIAVTADSPDTSRLECFAGGMSGYIEKPVTAADLKRVLRVAFLARFFKTA